VINRYRLPAVAKPVRHQRGLGPLPEAVDATKLWRKSTFCASDACVEVAEHGGRIWVRDTKDTTQPSLGFDRAAWAQFVAEVKNGRYASL
jgi:hypothetical protein